MSLVKHQLSFAAGELSPWLDGRTDIEKYAGGCRLLENFIVLPQGAVQKRPGMEYLATMVGTAKAARLVEFQISTSEAAMLVLGGGKLQVFSKGKVVLDPGSALMTVSGISGKRGSMAGVYAPVEIGNGFPLYRLSGMDAPQDDDAVISYDPELGWIIEETTNGVRTALWRATVASALPLPNLVAAWTAVPVAGVTPVQTGTPALVRGPSRYPIAIGIDWTDAQLERLRWKQINSVAYFVHPDHPPHKLTRYAEDGWVLEEVDYSRNPPLLPENPGKDHTLKVTPVVLNPETPPLWAAGTLYAAGKKVRYDVEEGAGTDVRTFICMHKHTSKAGQTPPTAKYRQTLPYSSLAGRAGQAALEVLKPLWQETFVDESSVVGEEVMIESAAEMWETGHLGGVVEISKRRTLTSFEADLKMSGATSPQYSDPIVIQGGYTFFTSGGWNGTFYIERSVDRGVTWTELRAWHSDNDRNVSGEGEESDRVQMRIKWVKDPEVGSNAGYTNGTFATLTASEAMVRGLVKITQVMSATAVKAEVITPVEITTTPHWRLGAWSGVQGYPRTVELHQGRVVMAASKLRPHTVWGSAVDDYENFYPGTAADEAFAHTIAIGERDPILWLVSERFLLVGTGCGEWILHGEEEEKAITPEFGTAKRHSSYGAHDGGVPACFSDSVSLFVQRGGTRVREFSYRYDADRYEAANLNLLADHLFEEAVSDIAVQRMPWQVVWFVSGGKLYGLTYERAQGVAAWHRHSTQGEVLSVATIRATSEEDEIWLVVKRGTERFIERFRPGQMARPADNGWWLDAASEVQPPFNFSSAVQLHGKKVAGWYDGRAYPEAMLGYDQWPFVTGLEVSGLYNLAGPPLDGNPNGFYEVAGIRTGWPWFRHAALGDQFRIELVYFTNPGVFRWMIYVAGAESFRSQDLEAAEGMPDAGMFWEPVVDLGVGEPVIELLGEVPVDTPPATITVTGKLVPDAAGVLNEKNPVNGKLAYGSYPEGYDPMDPEAEEIDYVRLYWSGSQWVLYCRQGLVEGTWVSDSDTPSPKFAMNWQVEMGAGIPSTGPVVVAGLRYDATLQPMTPEIGLGNGSSRSRELRIHRVVSSLRWSRGGKIGETPEGRLDPLDAGQGALFTGEIEKEFDGAHGTRGDVCLVSDEPYPFAVRSLGLKMNVFGDQ